MRIFLAPMEGVVDHTMRAMLTKVGGIDRCVTEFIRITTNLLPARVFYRYCPELLNQGRTINGTPVYVQLLGGNPEPMAINAQRVAALGAPGIDINFGCPAKLVNRNDGGSILLKEPERIFAIVHAVRQAVPASIPVTAKIRLGFENHDFLEDVCHAVFAANASELTIHARTKEDGYKPPAYWHAIADIKANSPIPVIANGEIWSLQDYNDCVNASGCDDVMLGRGLLARPDLAKQIQTQKNPQQNPAMSWLHVIDMLLQFCIVTEEHYDRKTVGNRVKQWLAYLRLQFPMAQLLFEEVKRLRGPEEIRIAIDQHKIRQLKDSLMPE